MGEPLELQSTHTASAESLREILLMRGAREEGEVIHYTLHPRQRGTSFDVTIRLEALNTEQTRVRCELRPQQLPKPLLVAMLAPSLVGLFFVGSGLRYAGPEQLANALKLAPFMLVPALAIVLVRVIGEVALADASTRLKDWLKSVADGARRRDELKRQADAW